MRKRKTSINIRVGVAAGVTVAILSVFYAVVLSIGLLSLPAPGLPIQNPWFTLMEVLILLIAPAMLAFTVGLHAWVPAERKSLSLLSVVFMGMCALVTCCVHFAVLTLSREPSFSAAPWAAQVFAFQWPSVVYALDILAWDIFFPLSALAAAAAIPAIPGAAGAGLAAHARRLLLGSAALAFVGLAGVPMDNMSIGTPASSVMCCFSRSLRCCWPSFSSATLGKARPDCAAASG